jgi:hypothetical protein
MPDGPGHIWLTQALCDLRTGERLLGSEPCFYCQVISKYQQAVEKAVKGIVADLQIGHVSLRGIGPKQDYQHGADVFAQALIRIPRSPQNLELHSLVYGLLAPRSPVIQSLDSLAPRRPAPGARARRNTEYPYQDSSGKWRAPADPDSFDRHHDVERYRKLAQKVVREARNILAAIARRPK